MALTDHAEAVLGYLQALIAAVEGGHALSIRQATLLDQAASAYQADEAEGLIAYPGEAIWPKLPPLNWGQSPADDDTEPVVVRQ
jgi:hypothetical protein